MDVYDSVVAGERGYPRPQLRRPDWWSLDGPWDFAIDLEGTYGRWDAVRWSRRNGMPSVAEARPVSTVQPGARARSASSASNRVLPMPGSPATSTMLPAPWAA